MCYLRNFMVWLRRLSLGFSVRVPRRAAKMILSLSMIVILLMCWTVAPLLSCRALLTEVTLVGGGDLTLSALLDLLMVAFGAAGMDGAVRNQAAATGTQPLPYIGQLLNRYLETALDAVLPAVWSKRISDGLSILANGTLYLDSDATAAVADFQRWAWDVEGGDLVDYDTATIDEHTAVTAGGISLYTGVGVQQVGNTSYYVDPETATNFLNGESRPSTVTIQLSGGRWYAVFYDDHLYAISSVPATYLATATKDANGNWLGSTYGGGRSNKTWIRFTLGVNDAGASWVPVVSSLPSYDDVLAATIGGTTNTGELDTFVGPMQQGQGTQLPLGDAVTVSSETAATMHLLNYLRAAAAAYAGTGTAQVPVTDVDTGEDELLPLTVPLDTPIGVTGVSDAAIDQSGAIAGTDAVAGDFLGTDEYTMDLTQFFPFCIPFDIVALYEKFEAEAAAPVVDWPIPIPGQEEPYLLHLDFSAFDSLAVWVRRLELIAFAVGLMVMTKRLIQGGD